MAKTVTPIAARPGWGTVSSVAKDGEKEYPFNYEATITGDAFAALVARLKGDELTQAMEWHNYGMDLFYRAKARPSAGVETTVIKRKGQPDLDLMTLPLAPLCKAINGAMAAALIGRKPSGQMLYTRRVLLEQHKVVERDGEIFPAPTPSPSNKK